MYQDIIYFDKNIELICEKNLIYLRVLTNKYSLQEFNQVLSIHPRIKITNFNSIKNAILQTNQLIQIGELKLIADISYSSDKLTAYAYLNLTSEEFEEYPTKKLIEIILSQSKELDIIFGHDINKISQNITPMNKFEIANGLLPIAGEDATLNLFEIEETKPKVYSNGNVNHYELSIINKVNKGDWLGERIEPTKGTPGKNIFGEPIAAIQGSQVNIPYDKKSVQAVLSSDGIKTTLYAMHQGAVVYDNNILSVCNCLEISDTVSFDTGNIDFDGYIDIKNSVEDNFSVRANKNIQIMGDLGIGDVDTIESREGSIYIRGGISGKGNAKIICNGNLYTKFIANCTIECSGTVNIGYYAMNANIKATEVILEKMDSKIIGGTIEADIKVVAGEIGNRNEIITNINILGFDKQKYKKEYDSLKVLIDKCKDGIKLYKQEMIIYSTNVLSEEQYNKANTIESKYIKLKEQLSLLQNKLKQYQSYLRTKGDGEVKVSKCIYPRVTVKIKNEQLRITNKCQSPVSYYYNDNQIVQS